MSNNKFPRESSYYTFTVPIMYQDYVELTILLSNENTRERVGTLQYNKNEMIYTHWDNHHETKSIKYICGLLKDYYISTSFKGDVPKTLVDFVIDTIQSMLLTPIGGEKGDTYHYDATSLETVSQFFAKLIYCFVKRECNTNGGKN